MSKAISTICGLFIAAGTMCGTVAVPQSFSTLLNSDAIVVGSASGNFQSGAVAGTSAFTLNVARVVKGQLSPGPITVSFTGPITVGLSGSSVVPAAWGDGIRFLKQVSGAWELVPVIQNGGFGWSYYPASVSSAPSGPFSYSTTASVQDKLASELAEAIVNNDGTNPQMWSLLSKAIDDLNAPITSQIYQQLASSPAVDNEMIGLAGLIRTGSISAFSSAVALAPTFPTTIAWQTLFNTIYEEYRPTDSASVDALGRAATDTTDSNIQFRLAAAHALARVHTTNALPYLATLLDDPDQDLRVEGVGGLGAFALGLPVQTAASIPSMSFLKKSSTPYRNADTEANFTYSPIAIKKNEAAYLTFWKNWWSQNRASIGF